MANLVAAIALVLVSLGFVLVASPASAQATITLSSTPTSIELGSSFSTTATITGSTGSSGVVNVVLFGPDDSGCDGTPEGIRIANTTHANGSETATETFTPKAVGTYRIKVSYSTENSTDNNVSACDAAGSVVTVVADSTPKQDITLTTQVTDNTISLGESMTDVATLTPPANGPKPTGNVGFAVYGPSDFYCENAIPVGIKAIDPNSNTVTSDPYTPTEPGNYIWVASYHGDDNYNTHIADCNEAFETVVVNDDGQSAKQNLTLTTQVSDDSITLGESVTDTATVTLPQGGPEPEHAFGFVVYGPDDATCEDPIPVGSGVLDPNTHTATSTPFTPTEAGTYRWVASYIGDDHYNAHLAPCNEPNETVVVAEQDPGIVDPDPGTVDPDPGFVDGDEDADGNGGRHDHDGDDDGDHHGDHDDGGHHGRHGGDLPDTGAQGSPVLLALGLGLTAAGYLISWRYRPGRIR